MSIAAATADAGQRAAETAHKSDPESEDKPEIKKPVAPPTASDAQSSKSPLVVVFANRVAFALALTSLIYETCRNPTFIFGVLSCLGAQAALVLYYYGVPPPSHIIFEVIAISDKLHLAIYVLIGASIFFSAALVKKAIIGALNVMFGPFVSWFLTEIKVRKEVKKAQILGVACALGVGPRVPAPVEID